MKILKFIILFTIITLSFSSLKASGDPVVETPKEIHQMLQSSLAGSNADAKIYITFMLNNDNEIVVISTSDKTLDLKIKDALNYQELKSTYLEKGKKYVIPFSIKK